MFYRASNFNQPLDDWNVASVTSMEGMFKYAGNYFNQPLDDWNVASVTDMGAMFSGSFSYSTTFNQSLNDWNVASVTDMNRMFYKATGFNQCLSSWAGKFLLLSDDLITVYIEHRGPWGINHAPQVPPVTFNTVK